MCSTFLRPTKLNPKIALTAADVSKRQPRNPLAREAVQPAHTNSTVATASEILTAAKTEAPKAPMSSSVPKA